MSNKFTGITSAGSAIPVYDKDAHSALEQKLDTSAFSSVSGEFATVDDVAAAVSGKADTSAIPSLDGYATEQWVGEQGYLTEVPAGYATTEDVISATSGLQPSGDYASATDLANYQPVSAMTAFQPTGDYLSGNALDSLSGTWETVTAKADTTALEAYQTIEGMSAYQPSGDYQPAGSYLSANALDSVSGDWNEVSAKLDTTAFSDVSGSFLTTVPDTYLQNSDLTIVDNKITEISGVPLSAGDELPASVSAATDYVTATSGNINDTINNVSSNSGAWGGNALPISAGPGIKVNLVDNTLVFSNDETVLFSGDLTASTTAQLTESWKNFEEIRCYGYSGPGGAMFGCGRTNDLMSAYVDGTWCPDIGLNTVASWVHRDNFSINANMPLVFSADNSVASLNGRLLGYWNGEWQLSTNEQRCHCTLILGINRISGNV